MSNTLLFVMVTALFVHQFGNAILTVIARAVAKVAGSVPVVATIEEGCSKVLAGIVNFFKHL